MRPGDYWRMFRSGGARLPVAFFREVHGYDLRHGTRTAEIVQVADFDVPPESRRGSVLYMASWSCTIEWTYASVRRIFGDGFPDLTVVDVGCGKGKFLLVWADELAQDGLTQRVIGVDYSSTFTQLARRNLARRGHDRIEVTHLDASRIRSCDLGDNLLLYLYNPFAEETLTTILRNLGNSVSAVAYCNPVHDRAVRDTGFEVVDQREGWHPNLRVNLYVRRDAHRNPALL